MYIVLLDVMLLHTSWTTVEPKHNFYITFLETQKFVTRFIAIFALLRWSGTEPAVFPRCVCIYYTSGFF